MKITILIIFYFLVTGCNGVNKNNNQNDSLANNINTNISISPDSLGKYAYLMIGAEGGFFNRPKGTYAKINTGTCFFVRVKNQTFLVSAKHNFAPCKASDTIKGASFPDSLYIIIKQPNGNTGIYPLYIKPFTDSLKCDFFYKDPDLFVCEVKDIDKFEVNSIENYISVNPDDSAIDKKVYFVGYPAKANEDNFAILNDAVTQSVSVMITSPNTINQLPNKIYDPIDYQVQIISGQVGEGSSGSPTFFKNKDGKWIFGGVLSLGTSDGKYGFIVEVRYVIQKISVLLK